MASLPKHLLLAFLLLLAVSSIRIQARESRFFSKAVREEAPNETTVAVPTDIPTVGEEELANLTPQSHNGYGLYAHGSEQNYNNNNNGDADGVPSSFPNSQFTTERYGSKEYSNPGYQNYENTRYGMSGTRYVENGKYYYGVNDGRYRRDYDPTGENSEKYTAYNGVGGRGGGDGYGGHTYGGNRNGYEYNGMEGYQNNRVSQERQEEYVP